MERIAARGARVSAHELENAIHMFFHAIDENGNGKLEPHEFAVAQVVVAQLAGEDFDEDAFDSIGAFDKDRSGQVTIKEFTPVMKDLCDALPGNRADIVEDLATKASEHINEMRRSIGREIREFFKALDKDESGTLTEGEMTKMANLAIALQRDLKLDVATKVPIEDYLSLKAFDRAHDGVVSIGEFIEHFLDYTKLLNIPKKDIVLKLKMLVQEASTATPTGASGYQDGRFSGMSVAGADVDGIKGDLAKIHAVLEAYA